MDKIQKVIDLLNPPIRVESVDDNKFLVDRSILMNLDNVIYDIQEGYKDEITIKTLQDVIKRIEEIESILESRKMIEEDFVGIMVAPYYIEE